MGTRSGDLDPGVIIYLMRNEKLDPDKLEDILNRQSGLFALSSADNGGESDVKTLEERANANNTQAALALDAFAISVRKMIGAYIALLGGVDLLVFTGGIGEHSEHIRAEATRELDSLGLTPDKSSNCRRTRGSPNRAPLPRAARANLGTKLNLCFPFPLLREILQQVLERSAFLNHSLQLGNRSP